MNSPIANAPKTTSILRDRSIRELQQFYQKPIAKVSTELIITIVSVILLALFAIHPTLNTMSSLVKDIEDKEKVDEGLTIKAATLSTLNSELIPLEPEIAILDNVIPNTPDLDGLLRRIERIASGRPIVLTSIQTDTVPKEENPELKGTPQLSSVTVQLSVQGQYAEIVSYLDQLTRMDREIKIENLSIATQNDVQVASTDPAQATSPQLQMTILLKAQYFGVPVEASAN